MHIAIIGAGLAGLNAARTLRKAGFNARLFDKGRNAGGRCATRNTDFGDIDHGLQLLDGKNAHITPILQAHAVTVQPYRFAPKQQTLLKGAGDPVKLTQGARNFAKNLAEHLHLATSTQITQISKTQNGWRLEMASGEVGTYEKVLLAIPPKQAEALWPIAPPSFLASVEMLPILTCIMAHNEPLTLPPRGPQDNQIIDWVWTNDSGTAAVAHATEAFSAANVNLDKSEIAGALWTAINAGPLPNYLGGHRWLYARTETPAGQSHYWDAANGIGLCGDWCLGPNAEHALESGQALALNVLESL